MTINRRQTIQVLAAAATSITGQKLIAAQTRTRDSQVPRIELLDTRVISRQPHLYHGWPTLAQRATGELVLVYSGGRQRHVCPFGRVELMRSCDNGTTWSWPQIITDSPIDDRDAGILETENGTLLVTTFTSNAYEPYVKDQQDWLAAHERVDAAARRDALGTWVLRSSDGGVTWGSKQPCPVNSPHGPIQLADGQLLYAGKQLWKSPPKVGFCVSSDDGKSWQWLADLPIRPGDRSENYHELHAVQCSDGSIVAHIRNHNKTNAGETLQSISTDGGKTWSVPSSIGVWGLPSHLIRLQDNQILMSYGHRRPPFGNQVRTSSDNGKTWSEPIAISVDGHDHDLGYPSTVQGKDGILVTVWYERLKSSRFAVLRQARWKFL